MDKTVEITIYEVVEDGGGEYEPPSSHGLFGTKRLAQEKKRELATRQITHVDITPRTVITDEQEIGR